MTNWPACPDLCSTPPPPCSQSTAQCWEEQTLKMLKLLPSSAGKERGSQSISCCCWLRSLLTDWEAETRTWSIILWTFELWSNGGGGEVLLRQTSSQGWMTCKEETAAIFLQVSKQTDRTKLRTWELFLIEHYCWTLPESQTGWQHSSPVTDFISHWDSFLDCLVLRSFRASWFLDFNKAIY